ncbi:MAG: hypothetical protein NC193_03065 [bacterium]|nr:hypothetical protein [bacterium]
MGNFVIAIEIIVNLDRRNGDRGIRATVHERNSHGIEVNDDVTFAIIIGSERCRLICLPISGTGLPLFQSLSFVGTRINPLVVILINAGTISVTSIDSIPIRAIASFLGDKVKIGLIVGVIDIAKSNILEDQLVTILQSVRKRLIQITPLCLTLYDVAYNIQLVGSGFAPNGSRRHQQSHDHREECEKFLHDQVGLIKKVIEM